MGRYRRDLSAPLRFEYPVRPYSAFFAVVTTECGLWPFHFCQLFGGEALVRLIKQYVTG